MKHAKNTPMKKAMPASAALTFIRQRSVRTASGCRIWSGYTDDRGHPKTNIKGTVVSVRKLVYEAINGPVPAQLGCSPPACAMAASNRPTWSRSTPHPCFRGCGFTACSTP